MVEKIISIDTNFIVAAGIISIIFVAIISWIVFKYSPVVLKTTFGFALFTIIIFISSFWIGAIALKNFLRNWEKYEISRLKEGAFVIIERRKSMQRSIIEKFAEKPDDILEDKFSRTIFDFLGVANKFGQIEKSNKKIIDKIPVPQDESESRFVGTEEGDVYLITYKFSQDKEKIIIGGENVEIRILPALLDMLSAKDVKIEKKKSESVEDEKNEGNISYARVDAGEFEILIFPQDENIISLVKTLARGTSLGLVLTIFLALIFFAVMTVIYVRRPILSLVRGASEIEKGNFEYEIKYEAKGDIGKLITTFNNMVRGLRRRDAQIKYRNELLGAIREIGRSILTEYDKEKIFQICIDIAGIKTNSKCAIFHDDKIKFSEPPSISKKDIENVQDGEVIIKNGKYIICYDISIQKETERVVYGKFIAEREREFIPEEKEFFSSLLSYVSSACQRSDYILKLQLMQSIDATTGLFNSQFFKSSIKREISIMKRFARNFGVILLEIENAREIIERFGYVVWDDIIKAVAIIMRKSVRAYDVPARLGNNKFALLLPNTESQNLKVVEDRLKSQIQSAPEIPSLPELELKLAVSSYATDTKSPDEILQIIDEIVQNA
jgi:diguanylate cyclase (GGDEF)-like protein